MNALLITACFAIYMILVALGIRHGAIDTAFGQSMLFILPVVAVTLIRPSRCGSACGKVCQ